MPDVLFASHPGRGHLNPLLAVAARVAQAGWRVVFTRFGPPWLASLLGEHGLESEPLDVPWNPWVHAFHQRLSGTLETAFAGELFTARPGLYAQEVMRLLRRRRFDAVVADFSFPGAYLAAEACGLPWLTVYHAGLSYPGPGIPPFSSGLPIGEAPGCLAAWMHVAQGITFRRIWRRLDGARKTLGLGPQKRTSDFWRSPWATVVCTAEGAEAPRDYPERTFLVGPCRCPERADLVLPATPRARVYVTLGTVFANRPGLYRRIIAQLAPHCHLIVSAGPAYDTMRHLAGPHLSIHREVPQQAVLRQVDAVVSHGGNNTVSETLAHGLPQLVLPVGGEQADNASRVVWLGAGLRGELPRLAAQLDCLLRDPSFRRAAQRVAGVLEQTDGPGTTFRFLERVVETGRGIERPSGYPVTVPAGGPMPWE